MQQYVFTPGAEWAVVGLPHVEKGIQANYPHIPLCMRKAFFCLTSILLRSISQFSSQAVQVKLVAFFDAPSGAFSLSLDGATFSQQFGEIIGTVHLDSSTNMLG